MQVFDVSVPIHGGMVTYADNPGVELRHLPSIAQGAKANLSELDMGVHTGTHVDAPLHFFDGGDGTETLSLEVLMGPAEVVDATRVKHVLDEKALRKLELPLDGTERVIFKTRNSQLWERKEFTRDFVRLDASGARFLLARGARLIGIDYLSIGDMDAHRLLLAAKVIPVEGLDLRGIEPGSYHFLCMPLRIVGSDGAPARAVLIRY